MNLAKFSIDKSRITIVLLVTVVLMGILSYFSLSRDSMPSYTVRVANVISEFPGASPERVEQLVTDKVEKLVQELPELKEMASTSRTGLSVVTVTLKDDVTPEELQSVWNRLRRKLSNMEDLPENVNPFLDDDGLGDVYGIVVGLTTDGFSYEEMKRYVDDLKDDFVKLPDAAKVVLGGVQEERIFVDFDNSRLQQYQLSTMRLQQIIQATNILNSGGEINIGNERMVLEPSGNFNTVEDIRELLIPVGQNGSQLIKLGDIATIRKGYISPAVQRVRIEGKDAISLHVNLKKNSNIIQLGEQVDAIVAEWQNKLPVGLELKRISSLDTYIDDKVNNFISNLIQSIGIVTIMTLMIMGIMEVGLNQVTLASLIIALGMMVDNAIVVAETIIVKMEKGKQAKTAAIEASKELFLPLLISTLTTSAAFLAFFMSPTVMGDIVGPIFVVVSIALLSSWVVALTVITMFCFLFVKVKPKSEGIKPSLVDQGINRLKIAYKKLILKALEHRLKVISGIAVAFVLALFGFTFIPFLFFPDSDRNLITVDINLPEGTKIETTMELVERLEVYMEDSLKVNADRIDGILDWSAYIGQGPESYDLGYTQDEANSSYAHLLVNTSSFEMNRSLIQRLDHFGFENFPNADIKVKALSAGGGGIPIEIKIIGDNADELSKIATDVKRKLNELEGTKNVKDDWGPKSKKFIIQIDQDRALAAGVSNMDIAISLQTNLDGFQTGNYRENDKSIPIILKNEVSQELNLNALAAIDVFSQSNGKSVPLAQVATIIPQFQYAKVKRYNLERSVSVTSQLREGGNAATITAAITPWLNEQQTDWPEGYSYEFGGDEKQTAENMGSVISYLPLSGFIIVLLLIIQFNSFRKMNMVILTIPLALIGVVVGLLIFQEPFGFMPFLGTISLAGIVINNAIVLIDRIEIEHNEMKRKIQDAIIVACLQRFRPILLATFTTVLGLIPLYISGGELWEGMAVSIMVGLLFGTIITLIFIPSLYSVLFKVSYKDYTFNKQLLND